MRLEGCGCEDGCRGGDVIWSFHAVQQLRDLGAAEGGAETDASEPKGLAEGLHDDKVWVCSDPVSKAGTVTCKVHVCLIDG